MLIGQRVMACRVKREQKSVVNVPSPVKARYGDSAFSISPAAPVYDPMSAPFEGRM